MGLHTTLETSVHSEKQGWVKENEIYIIKTVQKPLLIMILNGVSVKGRNSRFKMEVVILRMKKREKNIHESAI